MGKDQKKKNVFEFQREYTKEVIPSLLINNPNFHRLHLVESQLPMSTTMNKQTKNIHILL